MSVGFEAITSRLAWNTSAVVEKYEGAQLDAAGLIEPADGTGIFIGVVQYGAETAGDMCTVVQGIFPVKAHTTTITAGARVKPDASHPGFFVAAAATDDAVGVALMDIAADTIGSILMVASNATA